MQKIPYYQCGIAFSNSETKKVQSLKFTSSGLFLPDDPSNSPMKMPKPKPKEEVKQIGDDSEDESEDDDKINDQL